MRSPDSRSGAYAVSPRPQKREHPQGRAPCSLSYQDSPSLSTAWMHARSGGTCTFAARQGIAFTARCICCSDTLRKKIGGSSGIRTRGRLLMRELRSLLRHRAKMGTPRPGEAERPASRLGLGPERRARVKCSEFCRLRGGGFTIKACGPKKWRSLRVSHRPEILPATETTTLRCPRPRLAAAGGLAPPFTDSKSAVLLIRRHRNRAGQGDRLARALSAALRAAP